METTTVDTLKDKFSIFASSPMIDPRRLILKDDELFGLFDRYGDIVQYGTNDTGLYYAGTRFLSAYEFRMEERRLLFLSSSVDEDNIVLSVDLTNPDLRTDGKPALAKDSVHILRSRVLLKDTSFESITIRNFGGKEIRFQLELAFDSDFKDIFEIRGLQRRRSGKVNPPKENADGIDLSYEGLDNVRRTTSITTARRPDRIGKKSLFFHIGLKPDGREDIYIRISCLAETGSAAAFGFTEALSERRHKLEKRREKTAEISTSNERFNESIKRALADIDMMLTGTGHDIYPYGGIPWYCTPFGRDGLITAIECLWIKPDMAKGVLRYLARMQAADFDASKVAEPGKILHEARQGEMAALREIPFSFYYGSVDATPLFLILAGEYWKRTRDDNLVRELWPAVRRAIEWVDKYGDQDGDGFLEYIPHRAGLRNQGWKDSRDSVFHADGSLANGEIALCEVQGYGYAAKKRAAAMAQFMGDEALSAKLLTEAHVLREKFNREFWDEELGTFVLALDGEKRPCRVVASNAGQSLFSGIAEHDKALKVALSVTSGRMFSGWGVKTLAEDEPRYNPMSYHNGSIWPHDNALIAGGLSLYGLKDYLLRIFSGIFDASLFMDGNRLPELFCGFARRKRAGPTLYPVACSPQTWASGALLYMLQASLGMSFEAEKGMVIFRNPVLPGFLNSVSLKNLLVAEDKTVDLQIKRYGDGVTVEIARKSKGVSILTYK